jgi:hypothetical protein
VVSFTNSCAELYDLSVRSSSSTCRSYPFKFHRRLDGSATATAVNECVSGAAPVVGSGVAVARCPSEFRGRDGILFSRSCQQQRNAHKVSPALRDSPTAASLHSYGSTDQCPGYFTADLARPMALWKNDSWTAWRSAHGDAGAVHCSGSRVQSCHLSSSPPCHWLLTVAGLARSCQLASALNT